MPAEPAHMISSAEFDRVLKFLAGQHAEVMARLDDFSRTSDQNFREMKAKQDTTNGRLLGAEKNIVALQAVAETVETLQGMVTSIAQNGCNQKAQHQATLDALYEVKDAPVTGTIDTDGEEPAPTAAPSVGFFIRWPQTKKAAKRGGLVALGVGLYPLLTELAKLAHWIMDKLNFH